MKVSRAAVRPKLVLQMAIRRTGGGVQPSLHVRREVGGGRISGLDR